MRFFPIWLPEDEYPEYQRCAWNANRPSALEGMNYAVAEFEKEYALPAPAARLRVHVSADALCFFCVNGSFGGMAPASAGGDFLSEGPLEWAFENYYDLPLTPSSRVRLSCLVRLQPEALTEYTQTHGSLTLRGELELVDGGVVPVGTDESWLCRRDTRFADKNTFDALAAPERFTHARRVQINCRIEPSPAPNLAFDAIEPSKTYINGETRVFEFDKIYSGYLRIRADAPCLAEVTAYELPGHATARLKLRLDGRAEFNSLNMYSVSGVELRLLEGDAQISAGLWYSRFPVSVNAAFHINDQDLLNVMNVCRHTLSICRQSEHIDSPLHQELLACTGDYYIMLLMSVFESGDYRLADADVRRTAMWLMQNDGRMFHTTYSLIWVQMVRRLYEFSACIDTVRYCLPALDRLLKRFEGYLGESGLIENPPDYMFVDWTVLEGYSMHHPPKALGQTVLNAFYYKALTDAEYLYALSGAPRPELNRRARALKLAFNRDFWDAERRLYIDGKDCPGNAPSKWLPENPAGLRHFSRYPQALAALYGLCAPEDEASLAAAAADEGNSLPLVQPYFMHFVLEAVIKAGLEREYGFKLLRKWVKICRACPKGLQEGWIKPEEGYSFDHSHAWGGTPAWHLPLMISGLEILEPGFKRIRLKPCLYGLESALIQLPTPYGFVELRLEAGKAPDIRVPAGVILEA